MKGNKMQEEIQVPNSLAINQTFSITLLQVGELSDLQQRTKMNKSELVRKAIDLLYQRINEVEAEAKQLDE